MQTISKSTVNSSLQRSQELFNQAKELIPGGVNSPVRAFKSIGECPRFIKSASGAYLTDVDGHHYIDYIGSWGPMILGHHHPAVIHAIKEACDAGLSFGAPCELEVQLAAEITGRMPNLEQIRMVNSGTEAAMSAIRLSRAATGRQKIIKFAGCYHGHVDCLLVEAGSGVLTFGHPSSPGVSPAIAKDTLIAEYNCLDSVSTLFEQYPHDIAAIIVEPIAGNMNLILPQENFLEGLRQLCNHYHALLIFDEVMTGFRVGPKGAQGLFNIIPDITLLGKIIGGGLPVGAFGGRRELMQQLSPQGHVYQAGTLSGNPIAMAAGLSTLRQLKPEHYQQLTQYTAKLCDGLEKCAQLANIPFLTQYCGGMFGFFFTTKADIHRYDDVKQCNENQFKSFYRTLLQQGIYFAPSRFETNFTSLAHTATEIEKTLLAAEYGFKNI